nr:NAD(P)H-hydrate dehydratase [Desulfobulbaceae bacterium]
MKLAEASVMQGLDRRTMELGVPGVVLMENAGKGTVDLLTEHFGDLAGQTVAIVAGPGNNGGDGFVIARHLLQLRAKPAVYCLVDPAKIKGDARINHDSVLNLKISVYYITKESGLTVCRAALVHSTIIMDALFGTGLKRRVEGLFAMVIECLNQAGRPIVSVDIPSGLDSDTGEPLGACVYATLTATYGLAKPGHVTYPGVEYTGILKVVDIGIPPQVVNEAAIKIDLLQKKEMVGLIPNRSLTSHKGSFGHVMLLAGSQGKTGAAILAARAALRSGVGLVSLGVPQKLNDIFEKSLIEAMTIPLASEYFIGIDDMHAIKSALHGMDSLVVGPGIGTDPETSALVAKLYADVDLPMVIDADAITALAREEVALSHHAPRIFTPHPGEMARLTGKTVKEIQGNRRLISSDFAVQNGVVVVLKGAATVIAAPDGRVAINPTGNAAMAVGGMGDVLSGLIGALIAQGLNAWDASCLGVYVHGLAADQIVAAHDLPFGILASEVADEIPLAFREIIKGTKLIR